MSNFTGGALTPEKQEACKKLLREMCELVPYDHKDFIKKSQLLEDLKEEWYVHCSEDQPKECLIDVYNFFGVITMSIRQSKDVAYQEFLTYIKSLAPKNQ